MHFKLLVALVDDHKTNAVMQAARTAGATGVTVISNARGEGIEERKTFLGLTLDTQRDVIMFLVEQHLARHILEQICTIGEFESNAGAGIAFQLDVEDAVGVLRQVDQLQDTVKKEI